MQEGCRSFGCWETTRADVDVDAVDSVDVTHGVDGIAVFEASCRGTCGVFGDEFGSVTFPPVLEYSFGFDCVHPDEVDDPVVGETSAQW